VIVAPEAFEVTDRFTVWLDEDEIKSAGCAKVKVCASPKVTP